MNKLPHSWAFFNDGSEGFQIVLDYLNDNYKRNYVGVKMCFYGISKKGNPLCSQARRAFKEILTIQQFKEAIQ